MNEILNTKLQEHTSSNFVILKYTDDAEEYAVIYSRVP